MNKVERFSVTLYSELSLQDKINEYAEKNKMNPLSISVISNSVCTIAFVVFEPIVEHYI